MITKVGNYNTYISKRLQNKTFYKETTLTFQDSIIKALPSHLFDKDANRLNLLPGEIYEIGKTNSGDTIKFRLFESRGFETNFSPRIKAPKEFSVVSDEHIRLLEKSTQSVVKKDSVSIE